MYPAAIDPRIIADIINFLYNGNRMYEARLIAPTIAITIAENRIILSFIASFVGRGKTAILIPSWRLLRRRVIFAMAL